MGAGGSEVTTVAGLSLMMTREGNGTWISTLGLPRRVYAHKTIQAGLEKSYNVIC